MEEKTAKIRRSSTRPAVNSGRSRTSQEAGLELGRGRRLRLWRSGEGGGRELSAGTGKIGARSATRRSHRSIPRRERWSCQPGKTSDRIIDRDPRTATSSSPQLAGHQQVRGGAAQDLREIRGGSRPVVSRRPRRRKTCRADAPGGVEAQRSQATEVVTCGHKNKPERYKIGEIICDEFKPQELKPEVELKLEELKYKLEELKSEMDLKQEDFKHKLEVFNRGQHVHFNSEEAEDIL